MRTIEQAATYIREQDSETALTKTAIRRLVITGTLPSVRVGTKYLIALENLDDYLKAGESNVSICPVNGIRRAEVRP